MIISFPVILKDLFALGRGYPWTKPDRCPCCNGCRLWGHGFVSAFFDGYDQPFWLKRYCCPDCGCVIKLRPDGYFKRFQAPVTTIRSSVVSKAQTGKWIPTVGKTRQCHWFRALRRRIKAYLTDTWRKGMVAAFDLLKQRGQIPVSRSI